MVKRRNMVPPFACWEEAETVPDPPEAAEKQATRHRFSVSQVSLGRQVARVLRPARVGLRQSGRDSLALADSMSTDHHDLSRRSHCPRGPGAPRPAESWHRFARAPDGAVLPGLLALAGDVWGILTDLAPPTSARKFQRDRRTTHDV